jgi:hypothetical protein
MPVIINGTTGLSGVSTVNLANGSVTQNILANGVAGTGPAFSAYQSIAQSLSAGVTSKLLFQTEDFDTANCFASSTFTPNVAGYYQVSGGVQVSGSSVSLPILYKNGSALRYGSYQGIAMTSPINVFSALVYMNGTTDYLDFYGNSNATVNTIANAASTFFAAAMVRAA